jgi:uncharacterized membrane protein YkvA (DUF1232 family)
MKKRMNNIMQSCEETSETIVSSGVESQKKLSKAKELINKLTTNKHIKPLVNDSVAVISLLTSFFRKEYPIKKKVAIGLLAPLLYLVMPIDAIPDIIPVAGYLDDALILINAFSKFRGVIDDYKNFINFQVGTPNIGQGDLQNI